MRRLSLFAAAGMFALPMVAQAKPLNELLAEKGAKEPSPAKVYYQDGTRLEFPDAGFDMKLNLRLQSIYEYTSLESLDAENSSDFSVRNVRLEAEGHLLNKEFTYKISNDFETNMDDNTGIQDAYLQWNPCADTEHHVQMGQFKTPFGRQWVNSNAKLQFIDRTVASQVFNYGRQGGIAYHGEIPGIAYHTLGLFNGNSTGEGQNQPGNDPLVLGVYSIAGSVMGDYDRSYEGDPYNTADWSLGMGLAAYYGQARQEFDDVQIDRADEYGVNVDLGLRGMGFSLQSEFMYNGYNFKEKPEGYGNPNGYAWYVQTGYFFVPEEWEVAGRFGWVDFDSHAQAYGLPRDSYEYAVVLGYYLSGHNLKVLTGPTWLVNRAGDEEEDDTTDFRYQVGLLGYF